MHAVAEEFCLVRVCIDMRSVMGLRCKGGSESNGFGDTGHRMYALAEG